LYGLYGTYPAVIMVRQAQGKTVPVQGRLTPQEVERLDRIAIEQEIPVHRSQLITQVLRRWLESHDKRKAATTK
jgi:hypothetical protein